MKKVLIITYYWPPLGGAGVQRVLKFAKYLPEFGWQPIILTVENGDAPVIDESLLKDIPKECKIYKTKAFEPYKIYKIFTGKSVDEKIPSDVLIKKSSSIKENLYNWIRLNIFIPDAKIGWIPFAVKEGLKIIERENIALILSSSPPHTVQLIAKKLARKTGLKLIADLRDPWMELIHYQANKRTSFAKFIESKLEKSALNSADEIITVSKEVKKILKSKIENTKINIIPNGYDESDLSVEIKKSENIFTIAYTGLISSTKIPAVLFNVLKKMKKNNTNDFKLIFAGKICDEFFEQLRLYKLEDNFEFKGYLPHVESTKVILAADILLLIIDDIPNNNGILTGKIFEYLGSKKPIFAIGPVNGNANEILQETNSGKMVGYKDFDKAYDLLMQMYNDWKHNKTSFRFNIENYSRKSLTKELTKILDRNIYQL